MLISSMVKSGALIAAFCLCLQGQNPQPAEPQSEVKGMPPRATATDYQGHGEAGTVSIGAEFMGHSVPTAQGTLTTEEFVVIEVGLFGPAGARLKLSGDDFSIRINGKKNRLTAQPYGLVVGSLKDPEYEPAVPVEKKSKTSLGSGGGQGDSGPVVPPPIPIGVQRAMAQRVQRAALLEGDRALPQAGLIFFQHRGKAQNIQSVELTYSGPAGKAVLNLQP